MKKITVTCPHCKSKNTKKIHIERATCFDNDHYNVLKNCFLNSLESMTSDNIIFRYLCEDCTKEFSVMAFVDIIPTKVVISDNMSKLLYYNHYGRNNNPPHYYIHSLEQQKPSEQ